MELGYISLAVQLMFHLPMLIASQKDLPKYDFWDDSVFDNIVKTSYKNLQRDVLNNHSVDQCVNACMQQANCVSLFYNHRERVCERVAVNLHVNNNDDDNSIATYEGNRYYRYIPPESGFCPMENCFYYNRKIRTCWKLLLYNGRRPGGTYYRRDAEADCGREGARLARINTQDKVKQLGLMLQNVPKLLPAPRYWRPLHIDGVLREIGGEWKWRYENGDEVENNASHLPGDHLPRARCLVIKAWPTRETQPNMGQHVVGKNRCDTKLAGGVCEMPLPPELAAQGP